jgi:site-specific DNA-methyltransferase (adenine-specific)
MESTDNMEQRDIQPIYAKEGFTLYNEDNLKVMQSMPANSVDMVFADPPYMISKADWDISRGFEGDMTFHDHWITECRRILKPEGTIWITGTHHSIYQCGYLLQKNEFKMLNDITWHKPHKKRDMFTRVFVPAHETVLWARKDKDARHYFNHYAMNGQYFQDILRKKDERMHTVWTIMPRLDNEMMQGSHPTQKPVALLRRIVLASTRPGDTIFDPFNGGGTTGIAVASLGKRKYIGCDLSKEYIDLTIRRYEALKLDAPAKSIAKPLVEKTEAKLIQNRLKELQQVRDKEIGFEGRSL